MSGTAGASQVTTRVTLTLDQEVFTHFSRVEIVRDMAEISGSFELQCLDLERNRQSFPDQRHSARWFRIIRPGMAAKLAIDGEVVLTGWVDDVLPSYTGTRLGVVLRGRDRTGDLVDCAANPTGPAEYRNLTLTEIATRLCAPFNIPVRADVDVGARFPLFSLDVAETAMSAIEKGCRQRAILPVSDGVGGLLLTRGGTGRAPDALRWGETMFEAQGEISWRERFSEVWVKGQSSGAARALESNASPITAAAPPAATPAVAPTPGAARTRRTRSGVVMTGHARDPEITRYRPLVVQSKTQSGGASVQTQADWLVRVARAKGQQRLTASVQDWRAGPNQQLWRPNQVALVDDPYMDILEEMLIAGVVYGYGPNGATSKLRLIGRHALDLAPEGDRPRQRQQGRALDASAAALSAGNGTASR